jgi:hypothetical protein
MIDEGLAREAIGSLGTVAAMLIEDVHLDLLTSPNRCDLAANRHRLGRTRRGRGSSGTAVELKSRFFGPASFM